MSFIYFPTRILVPNSPILDYDEGLWVGQGDDSYLNVFEVYGAYEGFIMSEYFAPDIIIDDSILYPNFTNINGYMCWEGSGRCIYYSRSYGRFIMTKEFLGFEPLEKYNRETKEYEGDEFYAITFPYDKNDKGTATPRGSLRDKEDEPTLDVQLQWDCWIAKDPYEEFGEYVSEPHFGEDPKFIGLPTWKEDNKKHAKSLTPDSKGYHTYGEIFFNPYFNVWMLGEYNSPSGWWEATKEPTAPDDITLKFTLPKDAPNNAEKKPDRIFKFDSYTKGNTVKGIWIGEVSRWN